ncbi:OmpH family outer membrane protein [Candidatus Pelagibacter communis]|uniref:OmpH family outer membrane protein n=1 Tax=Pelagibacter ubique TaxID=198252 RepID=UPI00094DCFE5|nr:OmpH family outer membrane protein [Candidatus Pelagibacter ubique]
MKKTKYLLSFVLILFFSVNISLAFAEKIVYIDMEKIMQISKAGKNAISKINDQKKKDVSKFQKIEKELKSREQDLITKKNVISAEEFNKKLETLTKEINNYRILRQEAIDLSTKSRLNASADFAEKIKPILADYASENNIDMIIQKKNIIMGKRDLDITDVILKIVDKKINKLKVN